MPIVGLTAATCLLGGGAAAVTALTAWGPRLASRFRKQVWAIVLADEQLREEARKVSAEALAGYKVLWAQLLFQGSAGRAFQVCLTQSMASPALHQAMAVAAADVTRDRELSESIRQGVVEALRDGEMQAEVRSLVIELLSDEELQGALRRALHESVKRGIREGISDGELKELIALAVRDAFENRVLNTLLRRALKEFLADQELHRSTVEGAVRALNPFGQEGALVELTARLRAQTDSLMLGAREEPALAALAEGMRSCSEPTSVTALDRESSGWPVEGRDGPRGPSLRVCLDASNEATSPGLPPRPRGDPDFSEESGLADDWAVEA